MKKRYYYLLILFVISFLASSFSFAQSKIVGKNSMKFYQLIILIILLSSCRTIEYSLTKYDKNYGCFMCEEQFC